MFTDHEKIYKTTVLLPNAKAGHPFYNCRTCTVIVWRVCTMIARDSTLSFSECRTIYVSHISFEFKSAYRTYNKCYFAYFFLIIYVFQISWWETCKKHLMYTAIHTFTYIPHLSRSISEFLYSFIFTSW